MNVYIIIQNYYFWNEEKSWKSYNMYAVKTEEEARKDCIKLQIEENQLNHDWYKLVYSYEKLHLYY